MGILPVVAALYMYRYTIFKSDDEAEENDDGEIGRINVNNTTSESEEGAEETE